MMMMMMMMMMMLVMMMMMTTTTTTMMMMMMMMTTIMFQHVSRLLDYIYNSTSNNKNTYSFCYFIRPKPSHAARTTCTISFTGAKAPRPTSPQAKRLQLGGTTMQQRLSMVLVTENASGKAMWMREIGEKQMSHG